MIIKVLFCGGGYCFYFSFGFGLLRNLDKVYIKGIYFCIFLVLYQKSDLHCTIITHYFIQQYNNCIQLYRTIFTVYNCLKLLLSPAHLKNSINQVCNHLPCSATPGDYRLGPDSESWSILLGQYLCVSAPLGPIYHHISFPSRPRTFPCELRRVIKTGLALIAVSTLLLF